MNLLEQFVLHHIQLSLLHTELVRVSRESGMQDAKVELNLTPRVMEADEKAVLPSYQVSAKLNCDSASEDDSGPAFKANFIGVDVNPDALVDMVRGGATYEQMHHRVEVPRTTRVPSPYAPA